MAEQAQSQERALRVGIFQGGRSLEERLFRRRSNITVGQSAKNTFVVPATVDLPKGFTLFEVTPKGYALNFTDRMEGRLSLGGDAVVDLAALRKNVDRVRAAVASDSPGVGVLAVLKADAYGHGAVACARALERKVWGFAVSLVEEGVELRRGGIEAPIVVLGCYYGHAHRDVVAYRLTPVVGDLGELERFSRAADEMAAARLGVHLKIDSGMSRLGLRCEPGLSSNEPAALAAEVGDANWRIEVAEDGIHAYNRHGHHVAQDPFARARMGLEQLAQRVIARYHLGPLDAAETAAYLAHRLAACLTELPPLAAAGASAELANALFEQLSVGGVADRIFEVRGSVVDPMPQYALIQVTAKELADVAEFDKQADQLLERLALTRGYQLYTEWLRNRCTTLANAGKIKPAWAYLQTYDEQNRKQPITYQPCESLIQP